MYREFRDNIEREDYLKFKRAYKDYSTRVEYVMLYDREVFYEIFNSKYKIFKRENNCKVYYEFLKRLYASKRFKKDTFMINSKQLSEQLNCHKQTIYKYNDISIALGLYEYEDRQMCGKGGRFFEVYDKSNPRWFRSVYKNLNHERCQELLFFLNNLFSDNFINKKEKTYTINEEYVYELLKKEGEIKLSKEESIIKDELYSEIEEYNNRVDSIAKITFLKNGKKRASNILCTTTNPDKDENSFRPQLLRDRLGEYKEYDINGSIYRLSYNLKNEYFTNGDIYNYIFKEVFNRDLPKELRNSFKAILMPIYMKGYTHKMKAIHLAKLKMWGKTDDYLTNLDKIYTYLYGSVYFYHKERYIEIYDKILSSIYDKLQEKLDVQRGRIFISETYIMIMMSNLLYNRYGIENYNLYDALYYQDKGITKEQLDDLYKEATLKYISVRNNAINKVQSDKLYKQFIKNAVKSYTSMYKSVKGVERKVREWLKRGLKPEEEFSKIGIMPTF